MANEQTAQQLPDVALIAGAFAVVAALGLIMSYSNSVAERAQAATRHSSHDATLGLATTANSAMLILGGGSNAPARKSKSVKRMLRAIMRRLDQNAGAPVVT